MWSVEEISDGAERSAICAAITAALPNWFGQEASNAAYIKGVAEKDCFVVRSPSGGVIGLLSLQVPFPNNADIYWLGVLPEYHHQGIGRVLAEAAFDRARSKGCSTITVETLGPSAPDQGYAKTRAYYGGMGFKPLFELTHHGPENPLLYLVRPL